MSLLGNTTGVSRDWDSVEHTNDTSPDWPSEHYLPDGRQDQTGEVEASFATARPPGSQSAPDRNLNRLSSRARGREL